MLPFENSRGKNHPDAFDFPDQQNQHTDNNQADGERSVESSCVRGTVAAQSRPALDRATLESRRSATPLNRAVSRRSFIGIGSTALVTAPFQERRTDKLANRTGSELAAVRATLQRPTGRYLRVSSLDQNEVRQLEKVALDKKIY